MKHTPATLLIETQRKEKIDKSGDSKEGKA